MQHSTTVHVRPMFSRLAFCAGFAVFTVATPAIAKGEATAASGGRDVAGFYIRGGESSLTVGGYIQARYAAVFRDAPGATSNAEDTVTGFSMRRTRLTTTAALTQAVTLKVELSADNDGEVKVIDAHSTIQLRKNTLLDIGIFKGPGMQEFHASDAGTTFAEKSTMNALFNQGRSEGVMLTRTWAMAGGTIRARAGINDGLGSASSAFDSDREADFAASARVDWTDDGADFLRFNMLSGFRGGKSGWLVGAAMHGESGGETAGTVDRERMQFTADVTHLNDGWSFFTGAVYRNTESAGVEFSDWGIVGQIGYFVAEDHQIAGRLTYISPDGDRPAGDGLVEVGAAYNYFLLPASHAHKLIADVTWASDQSDSASFVTQNPGTGLRNSEDAQVMLRLQYQVQF